EVLVPVHETAHRAGGQVRFADPAGAVRSEVGEVAGDGCAGEPVQFSGGAEVVDVAVGDDDQRGVGGVDAVGGDLVVDRLAAAGSSGVDDDGPAAEQQVGVDVVPAHDRDRDDLCVGHVFLRSVLRCHAVRAWRSSAVRGRGPVGGAGGVGQKRRRYSAGVVP